MAAYLSDSSPEDQLEFIYNAMPKRWFQRSLEEIGIEKSYADLDEGNWGNAPERIDEFKEDFFQRSRDILGTTILNIKNRTKYLDALAEARDTSTAHLMDEITLKELLFYKGHYFNNRNATEIIPIAEEYSQEELLEQIKDSIDTEANSLEEAISYIISNKEEFERASAQVGADIWARIDDIPRAELVHLDWPYLLIILTAEGPDRGKYNEREGEYISIPTLRKAVV
ncbi:MAG: hypothetical protein ABEJ72_11365, partial [Candidatus Aenigmatarchaeota archaeon]